MKTIQLTVVVDNHSHREDAPGEHGLCLHLRAGEQVVLFDAGRSDLATTNLRSLHLDSIPPSWVALSHGHYDHTTGVAALLAMFPSAKLSYHPQLTEPKWILDEGEQWRYGGVPTSFHDLGAKYLQPTENSIELVDGIMTSGSIVGDHARSFVRGRFFCNATGHTVIDAFPDEQVLLVQTDKGLSIISGCMHTGLEATLCKARELFPNMPFYALVGGLHLEGAGLERCKAILKIFHEHQFQKIMPLHCSGNTFVEYLSSHAPDIFEQGFVGASIEL